ncbi:uncharacterized protein MELLADRAFT_107788 [Melampsora larici-populina 98AG31]|uniref:Secreted protein n=1 Tax=Melampsora larici-populina (strain 98AG31 / pathotype 3-4-7) TaxID=747676 RepID=F4RQY2_MELLP|nr:uncharacterized protein MELLADRAFT_107788 [Melampsora larici-populina 98AG31]EGG05116.1 hypothetical protein MELLADRAFT_107788 [Melampsora larici-populina 98AG31]
MIGFIQLYYLSLPLLVMGMKGLQMDTSFDLNKIPMDEDLSDINASKTSQSSFRPYRKVTRVDKSQLNSNKDSPHNHQFRDQESMSTNQDIPTPVRLSKSNARVWSEDLLSSLNHPRDSLQSPKDPKSSHNLDDVSTNMQIYNARKTSIQPLFGTSEEKPLLAVIIESDQNAYEGRHTGEFLLDLSVDKPPCSLPGITFGDTSSINRGLKRKNLIDHDEREVSQTDIDKCNGQSAVLHDQEQIITGSTNKKSNNLNEDYKGARNKYFKPNSNLFLKRIPLHDLGLLDFHSDESNYRSSMSIIPEDIAFSKRLDQPIKSTHHSMKSSVEQRQRLLPIEDQFISIYANQSRHHQKIFQYIRSFCNWIEDDSNDNFQGHRLLSLNYNKLRKYMGDLDWRWYSLSHLYLFPCYDSHPKKFKPLRTKFDDSIYDIWDAYDRLRWVRQVRSSYKIPTSRQKLCEAIMWGGYILFQSNKSPKNITRAIERFTKAWRQIHTPMVDIGHFPLIYIANCMRDMAALTEETWRASDKIRKTFNNIYLERDDSHSGKDVWKILTPLMSAQDQKKMSWDQHEKRARLLIEAIEKPQHFTSQITSWGFRPDQALALWNVGTEMKNLQKQQQMIMDQIYEGMNPKLSMNHSVEISKGNVSLYLENALYFQISNGPKTNFGSDMIYTNF